MAAAPQRLGRLAALILAAAAILSLLPDAALAAPRVCRQLEAQLAAGGGGRPATQSRRTEAAIARQQEQLQAAKSQARRAGCGFKLFGGGSNSCGAINAKIAKMERNLGALQGRRSRAAAPGRSRAQIMAALRANGCRDQAVAERQPPRERDATRGLFETLFGGGVRQRSSVEELGEPAFRREDRTVRRIPRDLQGGWVNDDGRIRYSAPPGNYRTLCVRTCDGYYFPMSSSSSPSDFERDQANCQSSCPGTEVQIYYHRTSEESDAMLSGLSGQPYADLPSAWLYKQTGVQSPPGCTCSPLQDDEARNYSIIAGNPPAEEQAEPVTPYPSTRPDPALDPETQVNLDGGLDADALRRMAVTPKINPSKPLSEQRRVRVVGPVFLPDPEAAADPQVPARTEVR
jgi:hypothetical protein